MKHDPKTGRLLGYDRIGERYESLEAIIADTCEAVRSPDRLTVAEAAEKYRYMKNPGHYVGPWLNSMAPYMVEPMEVLTSLDHTGMIFSGPSRTGKSDLFFNWLGYTAICDPADMMMVHMTQATARDWSIGDLQKMLRHSPIIGDTRVPGRQNNNVHDVRFKSGMRLLIKWPSITELSGKTIGRIWFADYDRMDLDVGGEGPPYVAGQTRTQTFGRYSMTVAESSPGHLVKQHNWQKRTAHEAPPCDGILGLYNTGDRRRWYWDCPSCGEAFEPDFHLLKYPQSEDFADAAAQVTMPCPHCGFELDPGMKNELNIKHGRWLKEGQAFVDGQIVGRGVRSKTASFWLKGPAAAFRTWQELVEQYLSAMREFETTGSEESLKGTITSHQGLPYTPRSMVTDRLPEALKDRAEDWGGSKEEPVVPEGVRYLVAAIDVQIRAFVVHVFGFGLGGDVWHVDMFKIKKSNRLNDSNERKVLEPATYHEDWRLLVPHVIEKTYPLGDFSGRCMQIKMVCCDSGGAAGATSNAYKFYWWLQSESEAHHQARFQLVKGWKPTAPRYQIRTPESNKKNEHPAPVAFLNSNLLKDQISAMLDRTTPGGGMVHFPIWAEDWLYIQLTSEVRTDKGWENRHRRRNEAWDLLYYAIALGLDRRIGSERINWANPPGWAKDWDSNSLVFDGAKPPNFGPTRKPLSRAELAKRLA